MVQFNLLPDVKIEFIKARRQQHTITFIALIVGSVSLGIFILSFFVVNIAQPQLIKIADKNIKKNNQQLQSVADINKMLTVQNQLDQLTNLHDQKPAVSNIFKFLSQITPSDVTLNKLTLDMTQSTITLGGTAKSLNAVRIFADTLKLTEYQLGEGGESKKAFSEVVLSNFSTGDKGTTFTLTFKFDPAIFSGTDENLQLVVPSSAGASKENVFTEAQ